MIGRESPTPKDMVCLLFFSSRRGLPKERTASWDRDGIGIGVSLSEDEGEVGTVWVVGSGERDME